MADLVKVRYPNGFEHVMKQDIAVVLQKRKALVIVDEKPTAKADEATPLFEQTSSERKPRASRRDFEA